MSPTATALVARASRLLFFKCRRDACATNVFIAGKIPLKRGDYTLPAKFVFPIVLAFLREF